MQNYYIPCAQQDRLKGIHRRADPCQTFFRRSSGQAHDQPIAALQQTSQTFQWSTSHSDSQSQTPSLANSSSPSQDDESSPRTPNSSTSDDLCAISHYRSSKTGGDLHDSEKPQDDQYHLSHREQLPSRPKWNHKNGQQGRLSIKGKTQTQEQQQTVVPVIQETAFRSRLARTSAPHDIGLPVTSHVSIQKPSAVVTFNSRCHRRSSANTTLAPPKLKRDTDCTDAIVRLIVCFSTKLVHAIWSESTSTSKSSTAFHGAGVLPLRVFIQETLRRSKTSYSTLQVALFYLILLKPFVGSHHKAQDSRGANCRALQCGRRMFLTALILASKYIQDRNYSSRAWSKISGLPINEINENERRYLHLIQFNLHMKKETFENWSKIVLTLCKVGESSMNQDLAQESSRLRSSEVSDNASIASDDEAKSGSDLWWMHQLSRLSADLVQDSLQTEQYLASLRASKLESNLVSDQLMASLDTPPSSPDSVGDIITDRPPAKTNFDLGIDFQHKVAEVISSPASVSSLPSRPSLPNLPTPQTTPRFARTLPPPKGLCPSSLRCKDSSRVLLGLDRQAMATANLETCPPPQPRGRDHSRFGGFVKREASSLCNNISATGFISSPESMISDVSSIAPRSRSSSMSSTSSVWWPSNGQQWSDEGIHRPYTARQEPPRPTTAKPASEATMPLSYGFYHKTCNTRNGVNAERDNSEYFADQEMASILASLTTCKTSPEPQCSAEAQRRGKQQSDSLVNQSTIKKQKRDRSSTSEEILQDHVREYVWDEQATIEVIGSPASSDHIRDKQLQYPEKEWACLKKPIPNGMHTKRFALHHDDNSCSTDLASRFLRDDIAMVS